MRERLSQKLFRAAMSAQDLEILATRNPKLIAKYYLYKRLYGGAFGMLRKVLK